jgi:hypothetical protein
MDATRGGWGSRLGNTSTLTMLRLVSACGVHKGLPHHKWTMGHGRVGTVFRHPGVTVFACSHARLERRTIHESEKWGTHSFSFKFYS